MIDSILTLRPEFTHMLLRFAICIFVNWLIVDVFYFRKSHRRDFYFTFMLIGVAVFFLVYFMIFVLEDMKGKTGIGIGIGLFGIFSIMRYRTDAMPVREMTYLFVLICLSVVNALASVMPYGELLLTNLLFVVAVFVCEKLLKSQNCKYVRYDRIALIKPEHKADLIDDLQQRLGLKITEVEVGGVDMLRDMAVLKVYYDSVGKSGNNSVDAKVTLKEDDYMITE